MFEALTFIADFLRFEFSIKDCEDSRLAPSPDVNRNDLSIFWPFFDAVIDLIFLFLSSLISTCTYLV